MMKCLELKGSIVFLYINGNFGVFKFCCVFFDFY